MDYPLNIIMQWMADFLLPLTRVAAMLGVMVGIGAKNTPTRIKAGLAVFITILIMPVLPPSPIVELFSVNTVPLVAQQILVGSAIGFVSVLMMNTFVLAGQIVAMQTGLGFASVVDPVNGLSVAAIGQFYLVLATLLFWVVDGHLAMIHLVVHSFEAVPIGNEWWPAVNFQKIAMWGKWLFTTALVLSLPPITAMLVINFAFGIMTRAAPQLNIFSLGFPVTMMSGLIIIWITFENFAHHFESQWEQALLLACELVKC